MELRTMLLSGCISVAMVISALPAAASQVTRTSECAAGPVTAASYTWNFKDEADRLFSQIQSNARRATSDADRLQSFAGERGLTWNAYSTYFQDLKGNINDIGTRLCRLETIRRVLDPWQRKAIDNIAASSILMADNTQDAIAFGNRKQNELWLATYRDYLHNLYSESLNLRRTVRHAVQFAEEGTRASS